MSKRGTIEERFWKQVRKTDSCWLWTGCLAAGGYGYIRMNGKKVRAHRVSYLMFKGDIPKGEGWHGICVCHSCDVRACVNPEHLFLGTQAENVTDAAQKHRMRSKPRPGMAHHMAKLNDDQVREIRNIYAAGGISNAKLGKRFGVSQMLVNKIVRRILWKHIE